MTSDGPALKGATNLVLGAVDHRETAFHPRAFREIYKFIAGREPSRIEIVPETEVRLSGLVTGTPGGVVTNRPVSGASVEIYRVSAETGERTGGPIHSSQTGADGRWGPALVEPTWYLEIVLTSAGSPSHAYLSLAVSALLRDRASARRASARAGRCRRRRVVLMSRPRGYFGLPRDVVLIDGKEPVDVKSGVPTEFGHDIAAASCASRPRRGRLVQPGADRGAGLAGVRKPDCGCRTDLLAVLDRCAFLAPRIEDIDAIVARMSAAICGAWHDPGYRRAHPGYEDRRP